MKKGRVRVPEEFPTLDEEYCSLGSDRDYYVRLSGIHGPIRDAFLNGIRDCVFNPKIWEEFKNEPAMTASLLRTVSAWDVAMTASLLRTVSAWDVTFNFPRILAGNPEIQNSRHFDFLTPSNLTLTVLKLPAGFAYHQAVFLPAIFML
jgi:hypothetical protein